MREQKTRGHRPHGSVFTNDEGENMSRKSWLWSLTLALAAAFAWGGEAPAPAAPKAVIAVSLGEWKASSWDGCQAVVGDDGSLRLALSDKAADWCGGYLYGHEIVLPGGKFANGILRFRVNGSVNALGRHVGGQSLQIKLEGANAAGKPLASNGFIPTQSHLDGGRVDDDPATWQEVSIPFRELGITDAATISKIIFQYQKLGDIRDGAVIKDIAIVQGEEAPKTRYAIHGATNKEVAIYQPGEEMVFTLKVLEDGKPVAGKVIKWTRTGDDGRKAQGEALSTKDGVKIVTKIDQPGFVRLWAKAFDEKGHKLPGQSGGWELHADGAIVFEGGAFFDGGACAAPEKLAAVAEPADFDRFWQKVKDKVAAVPLKAEVKEQPWLFKHLAKLYAVKIDCAGPRPVTGYLTIPVGAKEKSLKAVLTFHGYGVEKHRQPLWFMPNAIHFDVNPHGMELDQPDAYYQELARQLGDYVFVPDANRDPQTAYFFGMACRLLRAFEYVKSRPEWNGRDLESNGGSQGGTQGLWGAALVPEVTVANIWSPGFCDLGGIAVGRQRDWPTRWIDSVGKGLLYYDPAFMAKRIKNAKVRLVANYGDYTCPPSTVWIVYNALATPDKCMEVRQGCTHTYQMRDSQSYVVTPAEVRDVLVKK